jgi:CDP-diacylglycerol---glycerol-3-phosphate 3-phosphatidyltransferase
MTLADKLTAARLVLAPLFFATYVWGAAVGQPFAVVLLWVLFLAIEISDLLDGQAARRQGTVSDFGKIFDPFADVVARITYFVCFASTGIMPVWALLLILYREFGQLFLRMMLAGKSVIMGARPGGKLKAVFYMVAGSASLILDSAMRLGLLPEAVPYAKTAVFILYCLAVLLSVGSFADYVLQFRKLTVKR